MEERVKDLPALRDKMSGQLAALGLTAGSFYLFLRAFKVERILEVWIQAIGDELWQHLSSYPFCETSGQPGPKRQEGDRQIPEGLYHIDRFNPRSKFHLSLGLNYPNPSDLTLGHPEQPGCDIFIHGGCKTVGCIAITDAGIEEIYLLASWAQTNGQKKIPVHIYPFRFLSENWNKYGPEYPRHHKLWTQLETIDQVFEASWQLPAFEISDAGDYRIKRI